MELNQKNIVKCIAATLTAVRITEKEIPIVPYHARHVFSGMLGQGFGVVDAARLIGLGVRSDLWTIQSGLYIQLTAKGKELADETLRGIQKDLEENLPAELVEYKSAIDRTLTPIERN